MAVAVDPEIPERGRIALLHSNGVGPEFYAPLARELAARGVASRVLDLPGFAGAPAVEPAGWPGFLDAIEGAVRAAIGRDGVLVGHSLGGLVALLLAPRLELRGLVLVEPAILPWRWLGRIGAAVYVRRVFDGDQAFTNRGPWFWRLHDPASFPPAAFALAAEAHARTDRAVVAALHAGLPALYPLPFDAVRVPVVVVRGGSSGPVMALGQRDLVGRLHRARPVTIPRAGHWLANEQDGLLADAIAALALRPGGDGVPLDAGFVAALPIPVAGRRAVARLSTERVLDRLGPTLFTPSAVAGRLPERADGWELGAIRETQGAGAGAAYAAFVLGRDGAVSLVDLESRRPSQPVNRSVEAFVDALDALAAWHAAGPGDQASLVGLLEGIEAGCTTDPDGYWAGWVEEFADDPVSTPP